VSVAVKVREGDAGIARRWRISMPQLWAFVAIALPVVAALASKISAVDLAYHIRAGDSMLATHVLPRMDAYTFTVAGHAWLDQQWGAQVLLATAFRFGGWATLSLLRAALVGVGFLFVYLSCRERGASTRRSAALTLASFAVAVPGLGLRPQLFAIALFAISTWLVARRHAHPRGLYAIPLLVGIWVNLHGSFFLPLVLLALAWLEDRRDPARVRRPLLAAALLSLVATSLNPFGLRVWGYVVQISRDPAITRFVSEWQPPTIRTYGGIAFFVSAAAVAVLLARRAEPTPWPALIGIGAFFAIALDAQRGITWWAIAIPAILAATLPSVEESRRERDRTVLNLALAAALVLAGFVFAPWWPARDPNVVASNLLRDAPPGITRALRANASPGERIFNAQAWGSWLEYAFPRTRVAVDSRIELFPSAVWQTYEDVSFGRQGWQETLDRWQVDLVVASREQEGRLLPLIAGDPAWHLAYSDGDGAIYERSGPPSSAS
jgi:hypothetical protein